MHGEDIFGFYQHFFLHAYVKASAAEIREQVNLVSQGMSNIEILRYAMSRYAYIHELRHFHDSFGTLSGISLFFAHMAVLRSFVALVLKSKHTDEAWGLPFPAWAHSSKSSEIYREFLRGWTEYVGAYRRLITGFRPMALWREHPDEYVVFVETDLPSCRVPAFPFSLGMEGAEIKPFTVYYPLSITALMEGSAHVLTRNLAEAECPPDIAAQLTPSWFDVQIDRQKSVNAPLNQVAEVIQPYNVTDYLVSKYLRIQGRSEPFERDTILWLTDMALNNAILKYEKDSQTVTVRGEVGKSFVENLLRTPVEQVITGRIPYPDIYLKAMEKFLRKVLNWPKPDEIAYRGDLASSLKMIESVTRHEVIGPLLRARFASQHEIFCSASRYMEEFTGLPEIPVMERGDRIQFAPYMSGSAADAWAKYVMLSNLMYQICEGKPELTCFRAEKLVGGVGLLDLAFEGQCDEHILRGKCNAWRPGEKRSWPSCLFSMSLRELGLRVDDAGESR